MSQANWGLPKINLGLLTTPGTAPAAWVSEYKPVKGSAKLTATLGAERKAEVEGGGLDDYDREKSTYVFEYEVRKLKGRTPKIVSANGKVSGEYQVQLIPEDATCIGFKIDRAAVAVEDTWDAENGAKWKFIFTVLEAATTGVTDDVAWGVQTDETASGD